MTLRGRFISLEGGEGAGKSTQVRALAQALQKRGLDVSITREPGGSEGAEKIRELLLHGENDRWSARTEALLFAAARADHIEKTIQPALARGQWVISDRFLDSSLAYQGGAGGLGIESVRSLHLFGSNNFLPDRTLILVVADGPERASARDGGDGDRIGSRPAGYHEVVATSFREIARQEPGRVRLVDATGSPEDVTQRLVDAVEDLLP